MDRGEIYSKYFAGLENSRQSNNSISKLTTSCGNNATSDSSILKEMVIFYKKLYTSSNPTTRQIESYLNKINIQRSLNAEEQNSGEGMVTCAECWDVVKSLKRNKSPGIDGLPGEFYKVFFPLFSKFLVDVYVTVLKLPSPGIEPPTLTSWCLSATHLAKESTRWPE